MSVLCIEILLILSTLPAVVAVLTNSSKACTRGTIQTSHRLTCSNPTGSKGVMFIKRVLFGAPRESRNCGRSASYSECCGMPVSDTCVFEDEGELKTIRSTCSERSFCAPKARSRRTSASCNQTEYSYLSSVSFIEYECVNVGRMVDMCSTSMTKRLPEVHLASNVYYTNTDVANETCECEVSTTCNATLAFRDEKVRLRSVNSTHCAEELRFQDMVFPNVTSSLTCESDVTLRDTDVFYSSSNVVKVSLDVFMAHEGKVQIKASSNSEEVEVRCGKAVDLEVDSSHACPDSKSSDPTESAGSGTTTARTTTTGAGHNEDDDDDSDAEGQKKERSSDSHDHDIHPGTIVAIVLSSIAFILVLIVIICILIRRHRKHNEDDSYYYHNDDATDAGSEVYVYDNRAALPPEVTDLPAEDAGACAKEPLPDDMVQYDNALYVENPKYET